MTPRKRITIAAAALCIAFGVVFWHRADSADTKKPAQGPVPVRAITAKAKDVPIYLNGIGNVEALQNVTVRPQIDGQLMALHFEEGQKVEKGDLLAEIDSRAIQAQLQKAQADKASNQAQLQTAQLDLTRYQNLLKDDAIAKQKVDQQKALVDQLKAQIQVSQSDIDAAKVQLSYARITAPISGITGIRRIDIGNIVRAADSNGIVTITQIDPIVVLFSLPQQSLSDLQPLIQSGNEIPIDIMPKDGGNIIATGKLLTLDNQVDQTTGTIRLKAVIPNEKRALWPGQFVVARIAAKVISNHIVLPAAAVQQGPNKNFVYRVKGDSTEAADVTLLYQDDDIAVIDKGLQENEQIITDGQSRLKPGSKIEILADDK